jgi:hypothetical protein
MKVIRRMALLALTALLLVSVVLPVRAQKAPPPPIASYTFDVTYDPQSRVIRGQETARYTNRTKTPLPDLVFHLYLNAFRSEKTLWMQEGGYAPMGFDPQYPGSMEIERLALADGTALDATAVDDDATLVRATLPAPVAPGETVEVVLDFTAQLPRVFARTGWADGGDFVMAGQWFPKLGVWQGPDGWNAYPFHANSEFFADFGTYDARLTLPAGWIVGATGTQPIASEANDDGTVTHHLHAEHVIDLAWAASPHFAVRTTEVDGVTVRTYHYPQAAALAERVEAATVGAFEAYSTWYGPYGMGHYPQLSVIVVPPGAGGAGGMEYPTLFTTGSLSEVPLPACVKWTEVETIHELGHQWFQAVVATNEAEEPWLDEGFTDYSTVRAMNALHHGAFLDCFGWTLTYLGFRRQEYVAQPQTPMAGRAWELESYGVATYAKPAVALSTLERVVGPEAMTDFLRTYYERYAFAHPTAEDVRAVMSETLGADVTARFFEGLVTGDGTLDARVATLEGTRGAVTRDGDVCFPTEVTWQHRGTPPNQTAWTCDEPELTFTGTGRLQRVQIDPEHALLTDIDLANNGARAAPDGSAWLGSWVRVTRWFQSIFTLGGIPW